MSLEFLLVNFSSERIVTADDANIGFTNRLLLLAPDDYRIALSGDGYTPPFVDIKLSGTSAATPHVVSFTATGTPTDAPAGNAHQIS